MLKMNYSDFSTKTIEQIEKAAQKRGINRLYEKSRDDIIGEIIAHDAYYKGKEDARREIPTPAPKLVEVKTPEKREKYHFKDEYHGEDYYLELTDSQANFFDWLDNHGAINNDYKLEPLSHMEFEAP